MNKQRRLALIFYDFSNSLYIACSLLHRQTRKR